MSCDRETNNFNITTYHFSVAVDLVSQKISYFDERNSIQNSQCRRSLLDDYLLNPKLDLADVVGMACDLLITGIDTVRKRIDLFVDFCIHYLNFNVILVLIFSVSMHARINACRQHIPHAFYFTI